MAGFKDRRKGRMIADTQYSFALYVRPADEVLRERLAEVVAKLGDPDIEPAAQAALEIEFSKLRRLLKRCFQSEPNQ